MRAVLAPCVPQRGSDIGRLEGLNNRSRTTPRQELLGAVLYGLRTLFGHAQEPRHRLLLDKGLCAACAAKELAG